MATVITTMPKSCRFDHRLTFRRLPLGAFGKQDQDYDDVFNPAGSTLARPHLGLKNGVHLSVPLKQIRCVGISLSLFFSLSSTPILTSRIPFSGGPDNERD